MILTISKSELPIFPIRKSTTFHSFTTSVSGTTRNVPNVIPEISGRSWEIQRSPLLVRDPYFRRRYIPTYIPVLVTHRNGYRHIRPCDFLRNIIQSLDSSRCEFHLLSSTQLSVLSFSPRVNPASGINRNGVRSSCRNTRHAFVCKCFD